MFAESVNLPANATELPARRLRGAAHARARHSERRKFATRREPAIAAAPAAKSGNDVRAMREKLHQR